MRFGGCLTTILALAVAQPASSQDNVPASPADSSGDPGAVSATLIFSRTSPGKDNITLSRGVALFRVTVAGQEVWGLIDNRSERSVIDTALAASVGLAVQPANGTFLGPLGRAEKRRVSDVPIVVPDQLEMLAPALAAVDLQSLSALHDRQIGFVLGQDWLEPLFMLLDTGQRMMKLLPSSEGRSTGLPPPVALSPQTHLVELDLLGNQHAAVLDLALGAPMRMSPAAFAQLQPDALPSGRAEPTRRLSGVLQIGEMTARNPPVLVAAPEEGEPEIAIGLSMFRNTTMLVDFGQEKLWLLPSAPMRPAGEQPTSQPAKANEDETQPGAAAS